MSIQPGSPSLSEVLIKRTFQHPPSPLVDGELLEALGSSAREPDPAAAAEKAPETPAPLVDVRA